MFADFLHETNHFNGGSCRIRPFIRPGRIRPLHGLFYRIRGQDPKDGWDSGLECGISDSPAGLGTDVIEMGSVPPDYTPQTDDGIEPSGLSQRFGD